MLGSRLPSRTPSARGDRPGGRGPAGVLRELRRRWREAESLAEFLRLNRRFRFTREGWFFVAVTMAIGLAALNTGHNLFYLIFAMLVSMITVSAVLSERTVKHIVVERRLPGEAYARSAAAVELRVRNSSTRRAVYAVEVRDGVAGEPRRRVGFLERLDPGTSRSFTGLFTFDRRGRQRFRSVHLVTRFPFGLFEKTRMIPAEDEVVVYPAVSRADGRAPLLDLATLANRKNRLGEEIVGLRPYLPDDDLRKIHWRISARAGSLMVVESGESLESPVAVFLDRRGPAGEAFERAVEQTASILWQLDRAGRRARLYATGFPGGAVPAAMRFLAEVEPVEGESGGAELSRWRQDVAAEGGGVFVTTGTPPPLPPGALLKVA